MIEWQRFKRYDEKRLKYAIRTSRDEQDRIHEIRLLLQEDGTGLLSALSTGSMTAGYGIEATMPKSTGGYDSDTELIVQKRLDLQQELDDLVEKRNDLERLINTLDRSTEPGQKMYAITWHVLNGGTYPEYTEQTGVIKRTAIRWLDRAIRQLLKNVEMNSKAFKP